MARPGEGAIAINKTGSVPLPIPPRVAIASGNTSKKAQPSQRGAASRS
jgi:hypothetical protein